jgi:predicted hydrocarbon binding protein
MENDETVGRVLLASLYQAIGEVLPARLEFYESWLKPSELHKRTLGVASFMAVIGFLRHEGDAYDVVTARAGQYAAVWSFEELLAVKRAFVRALPHRLRARMASRLISGMLRNLYAESCAEVTWRGCTVFIDIQGSPFCVGPGPADHPLCGFYASAIAEFLRLLNLPAAVRVSRCRASGAKSCLLLVLTDKVRTLADPHSTLGLTSAPSVVPAPLAPPPSPDVEPEPATHLNSDVGVSLEPSFGSEAVPIVTPEPERYEEAPVSEPAPPQDVAATAVAEPTPTDVAVAAVTEPTPTDVAVPAVAEPTSARPDTVGITERNWVQIQRQWAAIATPARGKTGSKAAATPAMSTETERDPEAPWRSL